MTEIDPKKFGPAIEVAARYVVAISLGQPVCAGDIAVRISTRPEIAAAGQIAGCMFRPIGDPCRTSAAPVDPRLAIIWNILARNCDAIGRLAAAIIAMGTVDAGTATRAMAGERFRDSDGAEIVLERVPHVEGCC